jgi:hypothetical protein
MRSSKVISRRPIVGLSNAPITAIDVSLNSASSCVANRPQLRLTHQRLQNPWVSRHYASQSPRHG